MKKKNLKKRFITQLAVFAVVMLILALSFLTAENQRKQWGEDYENEAGNFTQTFLSKGYIPESGAYDKAASSTAINDSTGTVSADPPLAGEPSVIEEASNGTEDSIMEPQAIHSSALSPDMKYMAETYGVNKNITAGGLYPSQEIRLRDLSTDQIVWSMTGSYGCEFLWSPDSSFLAISYTGRTYAETLVVDIKDLTAHMVPIPEEIEEKANKDRPDVYLYAREWVDYLKLEISFTYTGEDSEEYSGSFVYDLSAGTVSAYQLKTS
jgi:hypothetical protein